MMSIIKKDHWDRELIPEINPHVYRQFIFDKNNSIFNEQRQKLDIHVVKNVAEYLTYTIRISQDGFDVSY